MKEGIILIAHGSRDPEWSRPFERIAASLFMLSAIATIGFMVCYTEIPNNRQTLVNFYPLGAVSASNFALGLCLGVALFSMGAGAIYWARTLMTDVEFPQ